MQMWMRPVSLSNAPRMENHKVTSLQSLNYNQVKLYENQPNRIPSWLDSIFTCHSQLLVLA